MAKTLLQMAGADLVPAKLSDSCVVFIDFQNEYLEGPVSVPNATRAIENAAILLQQARQCGATIIHVAHKGRSGSLFDRDAARGQIVDALRPVGNEVTVEKPLPNAFAHTDLHALITTSARQELILAGFMTHMCVSSTARAALDLGLRVTIDADSCGTRDLPGIDGGIVDAETVHAVSLAALADRFAVIAKNHDWTA